MNNEIQYGSDSDDSVASDNEGIVFAESNRKKTETAKQGNGQTQKTRAKPTPKHDLDAPEGEQGVQKPKKRRRTVEVSELPFHDEEEYADGTIPQGRFRSRIWNEAMDQELEAATREYEKDWGLICTKLNETFSTNLTNSQCQKRWAQYISPDLTERKMGPWSADEVSLLSLLVEQHSREVQGKVRISWDTVSRMINRRYYDCQNKWNTIKKANLKVGRFTVEEDEIIRRTVTEWDSHGVRQGMWIFLQNELGRRNDVIRKRWQSVLCKRGPGLNMGMENFAPAAGGAASSQQQQQQ